MWALRGQMKEDGGRYRVCDIDRIDRNMCALLNRPAPIPRVKRQINLTLLTSITGDVMGTRYWGKGGMGISKARGVD
jgi:hypothetical protein